MMEALCSMCRANPAVYAGYCRECIREHQPEPREPDHDDEYDPLGEIMYERWLDRMGGG